MCALFLVHVNRHDDEASMAEAALRDQVIGEMPHLVHASAQDRDLHAALMIEMDVHAEMDKAWCWWKLRAKRFDSSLDSWS